jgi:hypothetical protein
MNAALMKLHSYKCDVEWRIGQAPALTQFFFINFKGL